MAVNSVLDSSILNLYFLDVKSLIPWKGDNIDMFNGVDFSSDFSEYPVNFYLTMDSQTTSTSQYFATRRFVVFSRSVDSFDCSEWMEIWHNLKISNWSLGSSIIYFSIFLDIFLLFLFTSKCFGSQFFHKFARAQPLSHEFQSWETSSETLKFANETLLY